MEERSNDAPSTVRTGEHAADLSRPSVGARPSVREGIRPDLDEIRSRGLQRRMRICEPPAAERVFVDGSGPCLNLSSCNYLGLARDPRLVCAAEEALRVQGASAASSRLISGTGKAHRHLETELASFYGSQSALVFGSGYQANVGILSTLASEGDAIFSDALAHASLIDGCRLSRAVVRVFPHNDFDALGDLLREARGARRRLVILDGVTSMDGDLPDLPRAVETARREGAWILLDDSHGFGAIGKGGRGAAELFGLEAEINFFVGSLGKALGSFGAFVCGDAEAIELLANRARPFVFTCALPPACVAAAREGLRLAREEPWRREALRSNADRLRRGALEIGFDTGRSETHIIPIIIGDPVRVMQLSDALVEKGVFAQGIRSPSVLPGTERLRMTPMATHRPEEIEAALRALAETRPADLPSPEAG